MGQVAIVDGDSKELVALVETGYAIHILRASATGRYFTAIGRDGKASLIDLWMDPPQVVAEVKPCYDARSIESSKFHGYEDRYAIVGCYWPALAVVLDGLTLEPLKMIGTAGYERGAGGYVEEARVAAIVASHFHPEWIVNIKEAGQTWFVDYSRMDEPGQPLAVTMLDTDLYLHDGGWAMGRYFIVAANQLNKLIAIDAQERTVAAVIEAGTIPHPGRGANWVHPDYGPVWATGNLGSQEMTITAVDPEGHPEHAWEVVARVEVPFTGNLFLKTHPNSPWVIYDHVMSPSPVGAATLCAIDKVSLEVERPAGRCPAPATSTPAWSTSSSTGPAPSSGSRRGGGWTRRPSSPCTTRSRSRRSLGWRATGCARPPASSTPSTPRTTCTDATFVAPAGPTIATGGRTLRPAATTPK
jgi:nitrite reductase (NO-forming) / hydroxylamine reductase